MEKSLLLLFSIGASTSEACIHVGIHRSTFYRYMDANPDFALKVERAQLHITLIAKQTVVNAIKTNPTVAMWYLSKKDPDFRK